MVLSKIVNKQLTQRHCGYSNARHSLDIFAVVGAKMKYSQKNSEHILGKSEILPPLCNYEAHEVEFGQPGFSGIVLAIFASAFAVAGALMAIVFS